MERDLATEDRLRDLFMDSVDAGNVRFTLKIAEHLISISKYPINSWSWMRKMTKFSAGVVLPPRPDIADRRD
jgi:hypothetical protein